MNDLMNYEFQSIISKALNLMLQNVLKSKSSATDSSDSSLTTYPEWNASTGSFSDLIKTVSARYGVNPGLVQAVVRTESNFNPNAISSAGAMGLMQLMPDTARGLGVSDPLNPEQNVDGGVRFLKQLLDRYNGNVKLALAAYNAGSGAVDKYNGVPPYQETQLYINRILGDSGSQDSSWKV